jgi:hypothetical protein
VIPPDLRGRRSQTFASKAKPAEVVMAAKRPDFRR